jgi:hypothetical protein
LNSIVESVYVKHSGGRLWPRICHIIGTLREMHHNCITALATANSLTFSLLLSVRSCIFFSETAKLSPVLRYTRIPYTLKINRIKHLDTVGDFIENVTSTTGFENNMILDRVSLPLFSNLPMRVRCITSRNTLMEYKHRATMHRYRR